MALPVSPGVNEARIHYLTNIVTMCYFYVTLFFAFGAVQAYRIHGYCLLVTMISTLLVEKYNKKMVRIYTKMLLKTSTSIVKISYFIPKNQININVPFRGKVDQPTGWSKLS